MNRLYYGDNLDVLRRHVEDESVDLVYLDNGINRPPDRQTGATFKKAPKAAVKRAERKRLDFDGPSGDEPF